MAFTGITNVAEGIFAPKLVVGWIPAIAGRRIRSNGWSLERCLLSEISRGG